MRFARRRPRQLSFSRGRLLPIRWVVELYTSQGCSSCPPADAMLGELTARDDVIALSLHVDYWGLDRGWADTFADPAYSERQLRYAQAEGSNVRYTPQFIIGGADRIAGPSAMQLMDMIQTHAGGTDDVLRAEGAKVTVAATGTPGQLILVSYLPEATVKVLHGENAGHSITYHNVVQAWDEVLRRMGWRRDDGDGAPGGQGTGTGRSGAIGRRRQTGGHSRCGRPRLKGFRETLDPHARWRQGRRMIRAILFDKDGTLTDFRATWEPWMGVMIRDLCRRGERACAGYRRTISVSI